MSHAPAAVGPKTATGGNSLVLVAVGRSITRPQPMHARAPRSTAVPQSGQTGSFEAGARPAGVGSGIRGMNRMVGIPQ